MANIKAVLRNLRRSVPKERFADAQAVVDFVGRFHGANITLAQAQKILPQAWQAQVELLSHTDTPLRVPLPPRSVQAELKARFPWLGGDDEVSGADVIDALSEWYEEVSK